jgi:penicillin-binding protein 2
MDNGVWKLPDCIKNPDLLKQGVKCTFRNAGSTPHGPVNTTLSMIVSSDVYYYDLAYRIWTGIAPLKESIQSAAQEFGLGDRTTIRLPYEKSSPVPSPDVKRRRHQQNPEVWTDPDYRTGDNLNLAIGQGEMAVTVLNLAAAYGAFANGGTLYVPQVAFRTPRPPDGGTTDLEALRLEAVSQRTTTTAVSSTSSVATTTAATAATAPAASTAPTPAPTVAPRPSTPLVPPAELDPVVRRRIELPAWVRDPIVEGLAGVTTSRYGTASDAFAGFPASWGVAGKTGTAQTNRQDNALFVGFGPVRDPRYTVAVVLEQAGFGGQAAAPVARRVFNVLAGEPPGQLVLVRSPGAIDR